MLQIMRFPWLPSVEGTGVIELLGFTIQQMLLAHPCTLTRPLAHSLAHLLTHLLALAAFHHYQFLEWLQVKYIVLEPKPF
jgi:hypothetical protein